MLAVDEPIGKIRLDLNVVIDSRDVKCIMGLSDAVPRFHMMLKLRLDIETRMTRNIHVCD